MASDVRSFYKNKNVLLTGGTGFFGKMIIEKLLRTCEVNLIYVIVRPKKGRTAEQRLQSLFEEAVFERIREDCPKRFQKVHAFEGNLAKKDLGLSDEDREIIKSNVNVVFHCGASLNMDSVKLEEAVITNIRGTSELLDLMGNALDLQAFIIVSTAYSNCCETTIKEQFYEPAIDPDLLVAMTEKLNPNTLNAISTGLIGKWPNSYVFTKAVAEHLILSKGTRLPMGLFRPAIVTSTAFEPFPGWSDNMYGPLGILLYSHSGILRVVRCNGKFMSHTVPGDMCINAILCLAWDISKKWASWSNDYVPPVVNFSANGTKLLIPMDKYIHLTNIDTPPFKIAMWYHMLYLVKNRYSYILAKFALHTIPAYLIDALFSMSKKKPKMRKIYAKLEKTSEVLCYFLMREWIIENDNVRELWEKLGQEDKQIFNFDIDSIDLNTYLSNMIVGMKKFILKEDMTKLKQHKQRYTRLRLLHHTLKYSLLGVAVFPLYKMLSRIVRKKTLI
ncbi:unnamed protein product [Phaedon cochleariae]|uniref:Fatty acyl-CoA reductase n=1 Tax=Phaedon cochleariae TaxID=80249 RepID=A0A9P0GU28_PHACE|nr:unnamed protein product [Phaedon cochleariae]